MTDNLELLKDAFASRFEEPTVLSDDYIAVIYREWIEEGQEQVLQVMRSEDENRRRKTGLLPPWKDVF